MALIFIAIVAMIIVITLSTNVIIVITLTRTNSFNRCTKLHLSLFTMCDLITSLLIGSNVLMMENGYGRTLIKCKIITGLVLFMCNVMIIVFISMTMECISMLYVTGWLSKIRFSQKGWKISLRGIVTICIMIIDPAVLNVGLVIPLDSSYDDMTECLVINHSVHHPLALKVWIGQVCTTACITTILTIWLYYKLKNIEKRTDSLLNKKIRYTGITANNIVSNGSNKPDCNRSE